MANDGMFTTTEYTIASFFSVTKHVF